MNKSQAFQKAKSEVVVAKYHGQWSLCISPSRFGAGRLIPGVPQKKAYQYQRELVLERTLIYMGYSQNRVAELDVSLYRGLDVDTLDTLIEVLEVT